MRNAPKIPPMTIWDLTLSALAVLVMMEQLCAKVKARPRLMTSALASPPHGWSCFGAITISGAWWGTVRLSEKWDRRLLRGAI